MSAIAPSSLSRLPPSFRHLVLHRGEWSFCAMEHSCIGPVRFDDPGAPFHHLALPLDAVPLRIGLTVDDRERVATHAPDSIEMIEAGAAGTSWWDGTLNSACLYFMNDALGAALGREVGVDAHAIRSTPGLRAPAVVRLLRALHADACAGQPHGTLVGDAIFTALAAQLVPGSGHDLAHARAGTGDWRVRRALEFVHARLAEPIDIAGIAEAAVTSPFHLSRMFRAALGCSIWQYVLRERARCAAALMRDPRLSLADISRRAGFATYAGFIESLRREFGQSPAMLRRAACGR
jgi:AraC family transcriptional regulator